MPIRIIKEKADGRGQRAEGAIKSKFRLLLIEDFHRRLKRGLKPKKDKIKNINYNLIK